MFYAVIAVAIAIILFVAIRKSSAKRMAQLRAQEAAEKERQRQEEKKRQEAEREKQAKEKFDQKEAAIQRAISNSPGSEKYRLDRYQSEQNSSLLNITEFTPISKKRFVAFDLETTGLSAGAEQIVEIGAVRVEDGKITAEYQQLVNPGFSMPEAASAVNHITDNMLAGKPLIYEVLPAFLSFVSDDVLAAHNAGFDARFLGQACMRNRFRIPNRYFDTMNLARYWPDAPDKKLGSLIAAAGIENDEAHRALGDAKAVAQLILATNEKRAQSRKKSGGAS